ncbi:MAG: hypothetical protein WC683_05915 [bacterium]
MMLISRVQAVRDELPLLEVTPDTLPLANLVQVLAEELQHAMIAICDLKTQIEQGTH